MVRKAGLFPDNWIYIHTPGVKVGRIQNFGNWSPAMVAEPLIVKIDVEGYETNVVRGMKETMARMRPLLITEIEPALRAALLAIDPDTLTPRQAIDALYQLKRLLDE